VHPSAYKQMARCVDRYMPKDRRYVVVDFGSFSAKKRLTMTHRQLLADHDCEITGVDIRPGDNVDVVMRKPYRLPIKSKSVDVVISGQVFEHIPFFWASMLEIARVLKPGGYFFMTVPSRGHVHTEVDCWRYYPDGIRAMAAFAALTAREARTQFPPKRDKRHDYQSIDSESHYWGDTVGVFQKPKRYPWRMAVVRPPLLWWANRAAGRMQPRPAMRKKNASQAADERSRATV
jgi:SAM-dependent methyltransferase